MQRVPSGGSEGRRAMSETPMGPCDDCGDYTALFPYKGGVWLCEICLWAAAENDAK